MSEEELDALKSEVEEVATALLQVTRECREAEQRADEAEARVQRAQNWVAEQEKMAGGDRFAAPWIKAFRSALNGADR